MIFWDIKWMRQYQDEATWVENLEVPAWILGWMGGLERAGSHCEGLVVCHGHAGIGPLQGFHDMTGFFIFWGKPVSYRSLLRDFCTVQLPASPLQSFRQGRRRVNCSSLLWAWTGKSWDSGFQLLVKCCLNTLHCKIKEALIEITQAVTFGIFSAKRSLPFFCD